MEVPAGPMSALNRVAAGMEKCARWEPLSASSKEAVGTEKPATFRKGNFQEYNANILHAGLPENPTYQPKDWAVPNKDSADRADVKLRTSARPTACLTPKHVKVLRLLKADSSIRTLLRQTLTMPLQNAENKAATGLVTIVVFPRLQAEMDNSNIRYY